MADSYISFLQSPTASALAPNASLHYVTTTTTISEATAIVKHFQAQDKVVKKKGETILSSFGTSDGAVVETETSFEFVRGGGAILPQMDDNMLADSLATVPMVHVVQFDSQGKISQIRLYWDQSTMLKQVDAIGKSGRNWPIRDGIAQVRTIKQSVNASSSSSASTSLPSRSANTKTDDVVITDRSNHSRSAKNDSDFHARLFATGQGLEELRSPNSNPSVATRESAKPAPRQWDELFTTESSKGNARPEGQPKVGSGKNFGDNRLFDEAQAPERTSSPERKKMNEKKYGHFEFGHGEGAPSPDPNRPMSSKAKKHTSQWDFVDFVTPEKTKSKSSREHERHIGPGLDEDQPPSPEKRPIVHAPRPDARAHFNISDESSPVGGNKATPDNHPVVHTSRPENDAHFSITNSPSLKENTAPPGKARGGLETNYQMGDTIKPMKIYKTAGNGLGGRKGAPSLWDEPEPVKESAIYKTYGNGMGGRRDGGLSWSIGDADGENVTKEPAIYKTRGDGMGGRRDMGNSARAGATDEYEYEF